MQDVLNPRLYRNLQKQFGNVRISNPSQKSQITYRKDSLYRKGNLKPEVVDWGEVYYVSCPFCTDTRKRLAICHEWSERDDNTHDDMLHLATCFNEGCLGTRKVQKELHALIYPRGKYGRSIEMTIESIILDSSIQEPELVKISLPKSKLLSQLKKKHKAVRYVRKRGFDEDALSDIWSIRYCPKNTIERPHFYDPRIIIPIRRLRANPFAKEITSEFELVGWQARELKPSDDRPKYYISRGMKRNRQLYGKVEAIQSEGSIVLVEGVTDVWRYGPGALAMFGKTISTDQVKLLGKYFRDRSILILLDDDAKDGAKKIRTAIIRYRREQGDHASVRIGSLPESRSDPGECTTKELHSIVSAAFS